MQAFSISEASAQIVGQYPSPELFRASASRMTHREREAVVRLWISEGIPSAFVGTPMLFEAARGWLADRIGVHAKDVTIVGSGRLGYSLASYPRYGQQFGSHSDLDFAIVSTRLFSEVSDNARQWIADYSEGRIQPRNVVERRYWDGNRAQLPDNIARGFVDPYKVPTLNKYGAVQRVEQVRYELGRRLAATLSAPKVTNVSFRTYQGWSAFVRQSIVNIERTLRSLAGA